MEWIDSHCHLDGFLKHGTLNGILERARAAGVTQMIAIGTEAEDWSINQDLTQQFPECIHYSVGLHPCYVTEGWSVQVQFLEEYFAHECKPVALGEIGLDYFHLPKDLEAAQELKKQQQAAFEHQLVIAKSFDCPIVIHSRDAFDATIKTLDASGVNWNKVVIHCYSYSAEQIKIINSRGGRASFTGIVTYKNAPKVQKALLEQGVDTLMIETDSPYLTPEPHRGQKNEPAYVSDIGKKCAELFNLELDAFAKKIAENTRTFFGLKALNR